MHSKELIIEHLASNLHEAYKISIHIEKTHQRIMFIIASITNLAHLIISKWLQNISRTGL